MNTVHAGIAPAFAVCADNDNRRQDGAFRGMRIDWKYFRALIADRRAYDAARAAGKKPPAPTARRTKAPHAANDNEPRPLPQYWLGGECRFPKTYTGKHVWAPPARANTPLYGPRQGPQAANDNPKPAIELPTRLPVTAADFPNMASFRAWSQTIERKTRPVLSWPTLERLARLDSPNSAKVLATWQALSQPPVPVAENDNDPEQAIVEVDLRDEIRPTVGELARAIGWKAVGKERHDGSLVAVYVRPDGIIAGSEPVAREAHERVNLDDGRHCGFALGDLRFSVAGRLVEYGRTAKGGLLRPVERKRQDGDREQNPRYRSEAQIWSYLNLSGEWPETPHYRVAIQPMPGDAPSLDRTPDAKKAHSRMQERYAQCGVNLDGVIDFNEARRIAGLLPAERCPTVLKTGWEFAGGVSRMIGTGKGGTSEPDFGAHRASVEMARCVDFERLRRAMGEHAEVLDMACTDATAKQIGLSRGYRDCYAEKGGIAAINKALKSFSEIFEGDVR